MSAIVTFGSGNTLVDNSTGVYYGDATNWQPGSIQGEWEERSVPRGNGVIEVFSGYKRAVHVLTVRYFTTSASTLRAALQAYKDTTYRTLTVGGVAYVYCRMSDLTFSAPIGGKQGSSAVSVLEVTMTFTQVRFS